MISGPSPEGDIILDWVRSPERFERLIQDWMQMMPVQDEAFVAIGIGGEATAAEQVLHMSAGIQVFCPPATWLQLALFHIFCFYFLFSCCS
ncbi:unnamed protein product [Polarella glacialis]|uniref:Uncharacterized protein n=1 Tax=Polarella glacialis TaxID=89957 RepID=A0A813FVE3_POLGL|nr:unnamed protein product [Polarella glacialis]